MFRTRFALLVSLLVALCSPVIAAAVLSAPAAGASPAGWAAYVVNSGDGTVSVIDTATNTVVGSPIVVGSSPRAVAITPDGTTAFVTNTGDDTVSVISTATNTVVATIPVGSAPRGVAISPDGTAAYVTNSTSDTVSVISTATNTVVATIPVGTFPFGVAIAPDGTSAYVVNETSNNISVISTATDTVTATIPVGNTPLGIAMTPDGTLTYVANIGDNTVSVLATATNAVVATIPVGSAPRGVAISPDGTNAYVTNSSSNTVSVIDTSTNTVVDTIPLGTFPFDVALTPDGNTVYVTDEASNTVSVIDTTTNTVAATIPVGGTPLGIAITPDQAPVATLSVVPAPAGQATTFASASTVAVGTIASYAWDFGDGTTTTTTTPTTTHIYAMPGTFTASLTETSSGGTSTTQVFTGQTMSRNGGPSATATTPVIVPAPPSIAKAFSPTSVELNGASTLTFTLTNPNAATALTGVAFSDTLPSGSVVSTPNGLTNSCGGTPSATAGGAAISLTGGSVAAGATCTMVVSVTATAAGTLTNTTGAVSSTNGGTGNTATAVLTVIAPPSIAKAFSPATVSLGGMSTLTFTLTNPNGGTALTGVAFTDTLPGGVVVATPNGLTDNCAGTAGATAGGATISLTGASVAAGASCTVVVSVTGTTAGTFTNTSGAVSSVNGGTGNTATAVLTVAAPVPPGPGPTTTTTTAPAPPFPHSNVSYPNGAIVTFGGTHYVFAGGRAFAASASELAAVQKVDLAQVLAAPSGASAPTAVAPRPGVTVFTHPVDGNATIYVVGMDGQLHPFATPNQFLRDGYNGSLVITIPNLGGLTVGSNAGSTLTALATKADGAIVNSSGTFFTFAGGRAFGIPTTSALVQVRKTNSAVELQGSVTSADTGAPIANGVVLSVAGPVYVSYSGDLYPFKTKSQLANTGYGGTPAVPAPHTGGLLVVFPYSGS